MNGKEWLMNFVRLRDITRLILCIAICQLAGVIGSIFTASSVATWYTTLDIPWFAPPGSIISAVWIILFALMGLSLFLIWRKGISSTDSKIAVSLFAFQLLVNVLWSYAFFGLQSPLAAFIVIVFLWLLILQCIIRFWNISKEAALLLVPYILWVSFAAFLNYTIWRLNL
jgi:tryptophan-rich sensory protein